MSGQPECQCPQCGRLHHSLGFGSPPAVAHLMRFYGVETIADLIAAQDRHITSLQAKLPRTKPLAQRRIREG